MSWRNPVTNRTQLDILGKYTRGFFNLADWNRIYDNAAWLNDAINDLLEQGIVFTTITEPILTTMPDYADLNTLLTNIERVRLGTGFPNYTGLVELKTDWEGGAREDSPDYEDANSWENNQAILRWLILSMADQMIPCGVPHAGQSRMWQKRFRRYNWGTQLNSSYRYARVSLARCGASLTFNNKFRG